MAALVVAMAGATARDLNSDQGSRKNGDRIVSAFPPHPGVIRLIDMYDKSVRELPAAGAPEHVRFVYLDKNGREVAAYQDAVERVPVVEVQMIPIDANGNIVPKERASLIRRKEFGPDHRPLRSSTMARQ